LEKQEIAHLLTGLRADGEQLPGKQVQRPARSVASVFGLDDSGLPSAEQVGHVLAGQRADGQVPVDATGQALPDKVIDGARHRFLSAYGIPSGQDPTAEQTDRIKAGRMASGVTANAADVRWALAAVKRPTAYVELVWSADKSVSAAWALGGDAERALIQAAHKDAVEFANGYVASVLGQTRRGKGGTETERGEVAWTSPMHFTARPTAEIARTDDQGEGFTEFQAVPVRNADPQLHSHTIMFNAVLCRDGHVGALDLDQLNGRVQH
jgi:hypothetical protein